MLGWNISTLYETSTISISSITLGNGSTIQTGTVTKTVVQTTTSSVFSLTSAQLNTGNTTNSASTPSTPVSTKIQPLRPPPPPQQVVELPLSVTLGQFLVEQLF
jgi:hypothetical protein